MQYSLHAAWNVQAFAFFNHLHSCSPSHSHFSHLPVQSFSLQPPASPVIRISPACQSNHSPASPAIRISATYQSSIRTSGTYQSSHFHFSHLAVQSFSFNQRMA